MKYLSKDAAINTAKQLFSLTEADSITPIEAARAWGRENVSEEKNRRWLDNKMTHLKYNNLIKSVYSRRNNRRVLDKIQLTLVGKRAIGRIENEGNDVKKITTYNSNNLSLNELAKLVAQFRQENPEYQITFEVKLKAQ